MKYLSGLFICALLSFKGNSQTGYTFPFFKKTSFTDAVATLRAQHAVILDSSYTFQPGTNTSPEKVQFFKRLSGYIMTADTLVIKFDLRSVAGGYRDFPANDSLVWFEYSVRSKNIEKIGLIAFQEEQAINGDSHVGSAQTGVASSSVRIIRDSWNNATMIRCTYLATKETELRLLVLAGN
jgi:hypothetical protein